MLEFICLLHTAVLAWLRQRRDRVAENLLLRHQLAVLRGPARPPSQTWRTFLRNHVHRLWASDLFTVSTLSFKSPYVLVFIPYGQRELVHVKVTANPTAAWVWRQVIEATPWGSLAAPPAA